MNSVLGASRMRMQKRVYGERTFWLKGKESEMAKEKSLTVVIRPGDRSDKVNTPQQWLPMESRVPLYYIRVPGDQARGISPEFEPDDGSTVQIVKRSVMRLQDSHGQ